MKGMNALGKYGGALQSAKRELGKVKKDIGHPNNLDGLRGAIANIDKAIEAIETWKQLTGE